jgi:hypothetical protein
MAPSYNRWIRPERAAPRPVVFRFAMKMEKAAVGRAKNSGEEQDKCVMIRPRGEEGGRVGKLGCHLHLVGMGEGVSTSLRVLVCQIHLDETKQWSQQAVQKPGR